MFHIVHCGASSGSRDIFSRAAYYASIGHLCSTFVFVCSLLYNNNNNNIFDMFYMSLIVCSICCGCRCCLYCVHSTPFTQNSLRCLFSKNVTPMATATATNACMHAFVFAVAAHRYSPSATAKATRLCRHTLSFVAIFCS